MYIFACSAHYDSNEEEEVFLPVIALMSMSKLKSGTNTDRKAVFGMSYFVLMLCFVLFSWLSVSVVQLVA